MHDLDFSPYTYVGDAGLVYGGTFYELNDKDYENGFISAVRVTDLDSGGFTGGVQIEHVVILVDDKRIDEALPSTGLTRADIEGCASPFNSMLMACEVLLGYGAYDPDDSWDNYCTHWQETIQTQSDGPMQFDGWKASRRVLEEHLLGYVKAKHLR